MRGFQCVDEEVINGFERIAASYPDKTAIIFLGRKYSYAELRELSYRFAKALYELGIRNNDRVLIYLPNCPQWIAAYFGIQKIGGVPVPVSPIYTPYEIRYMINDSKAETIICQDTNYGYVREVLSDTPLRTIIVTNLVDLLPWHKRLVGRMFDRIPHGVVTKSRGVYSFRDLIDKHSPDPPKVDINPREHLAYILYTGGTTGLPKGVPGTHAGMVSYLIDLYDAIEGYVSEGNEVLVLVNPLFHIMGKGTFMGIALTIGNPTVVMPQPLVDAILEAIQKYKATLLFGVPALYRMILECDRFDTYDLSSLKYCWSGGDVLPVEVFTRFGKYTKYPIRQVYGSTETGHLTFGSTNKDITATSLGRPFPSRKVRVVNPDTLESVPTGQVGELMVSSPFLQPYLNKPEETALSFVEINGEKWYRVGDYVTMDEDGELRYVDRTADIIKHKGYRVSASEIEAVLQDHPAVIGACVVGVPDKKVGERIKAIVVLKADARGVGAHELNTFCRERLAPYKIPQFIEFRDMLPKSKVGKLLRRELRDEERRKSDKEQ
ncbi:MAG: AMP-binding protein [Thermodesulfobacteriota bacterium]|jgi:long-chain acyl-CoA synthetase